MSYLGKTIHANNEVKTYSVVMVLLVNTAVTIARIQGVPLIVRSQIARRGRKWVVENSS